MHLFTATDPKYFHHTKALLASWAHFHPQSKMFVFAVELADEQIHALETFGVTVFSGELPQKKSVSAFIVCQRIIAVRDVLPLIGEGSLVLYDADTIIRQELSSVAGQLQGNDIGIRLRKNRDDSRQAFGGVILFCNSPGARAFLECYEQHLLVRGYAWYSDQYALYQAYLETSKSRKCEFSLLDSSVMNRRLDTSALIWSPSNTGKKLKRFKSESIKYQSAFDATIAQQAQA